jgi:putative SOS response-associated peptidase YedK
MCNDFGNNVSYSAYLEAFSQIRAPVLFPVAAPNLEVRHDIWPTETAPVFRRRKEGVELVQLRWGFPPAWPKGAPVINFRSEGRRFPRFAARRRGNARLCPHTHRRLPPTMIFERNRWILIRVFALRPGQPCRKEG